jgi:hypothetical protein
VGRGEGGELIKVGGRFLYADNVMNRGVGIIKEGNKYIVGFMAIERYYTYVLIGICSGCVIH